MIGTSVTPCAHLSKYFKLLKSFPVDKMIVMPSTPKVVLAARYIELIGKNLDEIIANIKMTDNVNHYNRLRCIQFDCDSSAIILAIWKYNDRIFVFEFSIRNVTKWHTKSTFDVDYELQKMWEIVGNTKALLNMTGVDKMTYQEITQYMQDFKEDFILLKSV